MRGGAGECRRDAQRGGQVHRIRRGEDGDDLDGQGCEPHERDGLHETPCGNLCAVAGSVDRAGPHAGEDAFRHHALRECAGLERFGHSPLQGPDLQGRSGDCHASGHYALLYDDPRGVPSGHGGRHDVDGQSDLRLRHGRIG